VEHLPLLTSTTHEKSKAPCLIEDPKQVLKFQLKMKRSDLDVLSRKYHNSTPVHSMSQKHLLSKPVDEVEEVEIIIKRRGCRPVQTSSVSCKEMVPSTETLKQRKLKVLQLRQKQKEYSSQINQKQFNRYYYSFQRQFEQLSSPS
jgi:transposase